MDSIGGASGALDTTIHPSASTAPLQEPTMNRIPSLSRIATAAAFAALAASSLPALAEGPIEAPLSTPQATAPASTLTRAEVQAAAAEARRTGANRVYSISYNPFADMRTTERPRDAIRTEARIAQLRSVAVPETGSQSLTGEDSGSFALARAAQPEATQRLLARR
jgi:hypothetical protein